MKKVLLLLASVLFVAMVAKSQPVNFSWAKSFGGKGSDGPIGITEDASGNLYVTGEFVGTRDFGSFSLTAIGFSDIFVAKYSASGTCLWATRGGAQFSAAYGGKIAVSGNELFVTGNFTNQIDINGQITSSNGNRDIFVAGLDASTGTCNWIYNAGSSTFDDIPYGIVPATGGGFYLCGYFTGTATFGAYTVTSSSIVDFDIFYAKYTSTGTCTWVNRIGNTGIDKAFSIKEIPSGHIIITGSFEGNVIFGAGNTLSSSGGSDQFLAKFDANGLPVWAVSGGGDNNDVGYGVSYDAIGNIYTTGFIADTADFGSVQINNPGGINVLTAKFSSAGICSWVKMGGASNDDIGFDISTDAGGSSYVTGYINGNCFFGTTQVSGVNGIDIFIVKYDIAGTLRWITRVGGSNFDKGKAILQDANGFCHVAGDFVDNVVFGTTGLNTDPGVTGNFLTRVGGGSVGLTEIENIPFSVYPNPTSDFVYLNLDKITDAAFTVSLLTLEGKAVQSTTLSANEVSSGYKLDLKNVAAGNYLLKLETSKGDFSRTVVIQ